MSEWTNGPWSSHIREMTGADGETRRKCLIEKGGVVAIRKAEGLK